jgi:hypothetical protein
MVIWPALSWWRRPDSDFEAREADAGEDMEVRFYQKKSESSREN